MPQPRSRDRAAQWRNDVARVASYLFDRAATPEQRAELEAAYAELTATPDFTRYRRDSGFKEAPQICTDRNYLARLMFMAETIERKSYTTRAKGKHGGALGQAAIRLFRVLLFVVSKREGRLYPSLDTLGRLARMSKPTVVAALKRLALFGFITIHRRIKRVLSALGSWKVVQDSNGYEYHEPRGLGALGWAVYGKSELSRLPARSIQQSKKEVWQAAEAAAAVFDNLETALAEARRRTRGP